MPDQPGMVTFDVVTDDDVINFGIGQPAPELMPVDVLRTAADDFLKRADPLELNYGERQGDIGFREALADFLTSNYSHPVTADSLLLSNGNSQALDFVCARFTQPGDTVFIEEPTYFLAHRIFTDHGLNIVGIPMDADGMRLDVFREKLLTSRPALVYTIPSYHNPCSCTLSGERRRELVALSREHGFVIAADEVYQMLHYSEQPPPALGTMIGDGNVLSLGTFSKIMAPALRLGWIQASPALMKQMLACGVINSGGSFNHFTSGVLRHAIEMGLQQEMLDWLRPEYQARLDAMDKALHKMLAGRARWQRPAGGYFFWLELEKDIDVAALKPMALQNGVGFQPGPVFSCERSFSNFMRLSFAHYSIDEINEGVRRLAPLIL
jgi:DNA-binding transcriptional MocR family regulator